MEVTLSEIKNKIEKFATKPSFVFVVCAVAFIFHALAFDVAGLLLFGIVGGIFLVAFDDSRPALTVILFTIFIVSTQNSTGFPTSSHEGCYYYRKSTLIPLAVCGCFLVGCMAVRCVKHRKNFASAKFTLPLVAVSVSMLLSGVVGAAENDYGKSVLFSLIAVGSYLGLYVALTGIIDGADGLLDYSMTLLSGIALIISLEVLYVYFLNLLPPFEFLPENWRKCMRAGENFGFSITYWKIFIVTGCGVSNQSGEMIAFLLPAVFYKILKTEKYLGYHIIALIASASIVLTFSRTGIAVGGTLFVVLTVVTAVKLEKKKLFIGVSSAVAAIGIALFTALCLIPDSPLLRYILPSKGPGLNGRYELWKTAIEYFKEMPLFGRGYAYPYLDSRFVERFGPSVSVFRSLFHNFVFQEIASGGIVGVAALGYATVSVFWRLIKEKYEGKFYFLCFIIAFAVVSSFDILYFIPYYVLFLMFVIVLAEKGIEKTKTHPLEVRKDERKKA